MLAIFYYGDHTKVVRMPHGNRKYGEKPHVRSSHLVRDEILERPLTEAPRDVSMSCISYDLLDSINDEAR